MKQFKCEICGGTSIIQIDEKTYECQDCGLQYDVAEVETLIVLPQEVVEEPAELTVEEQEDLQPTFDVPQELEDNFTEKVNAEQETEEIAVETDSETFPKYIENTLIKSAESEDNDNSIAIEEEPQSEAAEETADEISFVESEINGIEDVVSENEDKSEETEADEQKEAVKSNAIIPWYKNKKIIIPSIAGIALALVTVVLLIVLLPKGNIPISADNSSDIQSTVESSQVESTQEPSESIVESSVSNSSKEESNKPTTNSVSSNFVTNADPNVVAKARTFQDAGRSGKEESNAFGDVIKVYYYYDSGSIAEEHSYIYNSNRKNIKCISSYYLQDGTKDQYQEQDFEKSTFYKEMYYSEGNHKGKLSQTQMSKGTTYSYGSLNEGYHEISDYGYYANGKCSSIITHVWENGVCVSSREENYNEYGVKDVYREYGVNSEITKEIFYDENGNEIA